LQYVNISQCTTKHNITAALVELLLFPAHFSYMLYQQVKGQEPPAPCQNSLHLHATIWAEIV